MSYHANACRCADCIQAKTNAGPRDATSLRGKGYRLVLRESGFFDWVHPATVGPKDFDCTDLSDADFEKVVRDNVRCVA